MLGLGLSFAAGIAAFFLLPEPPPLWVSACIGAALVLLAWKLAPLRPLALAALGALWAQLHVGPMSGAPFPDALARVPLVIEGAVVSIPATTGARVRLVLDVEHTERKGRPLPFRGLVRLSCYRHCPAFRAGERWRLPVRLKPPHGYANPGGFDYERWLLARGIRATGYLRRGPELERLSAGAGVHWLTRWRQELAEHLSEALADSPQRGVIQALIVGERSGVDSATWDVLTRTGTNHLMAISGLHVGLIAGAVFFLVRRTWSYSAAAALRLAAPRAAALAAGLAALGYAALAGFSVSTQRALIMLAVVLGAVLLRRTLRHGHALTLALVGVLLWDPQAVLSYGFWLSFGAVAVLLFNLGQRLPDRGLWTRWGQAQWAVGIGLLPLLLLFFARASLVAPLVNLVAVPLFSLILLPAVLLGTLLSFVPGLEWPLSLTAQVLDWVIGGLAWVADQPWAAAHLSVKPLWAWCAAGLGVVLLLAPRGLPGRWLGMILLLPMLWVRPPHPPPGKAWVTLLDVGQGLAIVVRTAGGTLVYDTGPAYPGGFDTGAQVIGPFLRTRGIERVDRLVVSHADRDHAGGAAGLASALEVGEIVSGEPTRLALPGVSACRAGQGWEWSGVSFRFVGPVETDATGNDASCALLVRSPGAALLVTGDTERAAELKLVERFGAQLQADVLIAGHHGSATSTSAELLAAVSPHWLLVSSGYANAFGFPDPEVVARARAGGAKVMDTALAGAIRFDLGATGLRRPPIGWRDEHRRLWTHWPERGRAP